MFLINFILGFLGGVGVAEILLILLIGIVPIGLFIYAILDLVKRDFSDSSVKIIWGLVIVFMPLLGSVIYLIAGRK